MNNYNFRYRFMEYLWWLFAVPIYGMAACPSIYILHILFSYSLVMFSLAIPLAFFLFIVVLLLILGAIFTCIPKIQEGYYSLERKGEVLKWMLCAGMNNYVRLIGIQRLIYSNPFLRKIYFMAFRAKIHPSAIIAYDVVLVDPFLLEIGKNAKIGDLAKISGHFSDTKKFVLKKVVIEEGVIIGGNSSVAPGVIMRKRSMLCAESIVTPEKTIPKNEVWFGRPAKKIIT